MMDELLQWGGYVACSLVLVGCICRVDMMRAASHRLGWILLYILWAPFALGMLIDLATERYLDWWACFGLAGILLHMLLTRNRWKVGPPAETMKGRKP